MQFVQITKGTNDPNLVGPVPGLTKSKKTLVEKSIKEETSNPIFNFKQDFVDNLQKLTSLELGSAVPYVALRSVDDQGKVLIDFNLALFQKPIDFSKLSSKERFSDRPVASLVEMKVKSDQGSGYIYFQEISFTIKVHKPDIAFNGILISLLFPGMPMQIEYGWKNSTSKNPFFKTEILNFALKSYNLSYTQDGQIDLIIDGTAFSERFNNTLLGDEKIDKNADEETQRKNNLSNTYNSISKFKDFVLSVKNNPDKTGKRDMKLLEKMLTGYESTLASVAKETRDNFRKNMDSLEDHAQSGAQYHEKNKKAQELFPGKKGMITLHDLVSTMCEKTFLAFRQVASIGDLRFLYGMFHAEVGKNQSKFSGMPIADFPIDLKLFREKMSANIAAKGTEVLTLEAFFNIIIRDFLHNDGYWKKLESTSDGVSIPHMYLAINNYKPNGEKSNTRMDISLVDINQGIPMTSELIKGEGDISAGKFEEKIKNAGIPIIKLGHGNSFVREMKMNNVMDEYMKATLIKRMSEASSTYTKSWIPAELQSAIGGADVKTPLHLPLQGSMTVLGSSDWKPFRAIGLISGIWIIDGIYKIMSVTHTISAAGFQTSFDILYH